MGNDNQPEPVRTECGTERVEAFSDGVFAIATFYAVGLLLPAVFWTLMWLYGCYGRRLVDHRLEPRFLWILTAKYVGSVVVYSMAVLVSFFAFKLGVALCVGLTLLYLTPPHFPALAATGGVEG